MEIDAWINVLMLFQDGEISTSKTRKRSHQKKGNSPGAKRLHQSTVSGVRPPWARWWRGGSGLSDINDSWRLEIFMLTATCDWLPGLTSDWERRQGQKGGTLKSCKRSGSRRARGQAASLTEVLLHFIFHGNFTIVSQTFLKPIKKIFKSTQNIGKEDSLSVRGAHCPFPCPVLKILILIN